MVADLTSGNARQLLAGFDLIMDGTDNFEARFLINDLSILTGTPWIYAGAIGGEGMVWPLDPPRTPCLRCLMEEPPAGGRRGHLRQRGRPGPRRGHRGQLGGPGGHQDPHRAASPTRTWPASTSGATSGSSCKPPASPLPVLHRQGHRVPERPLDHDGLPPVRPGGGPDPGQPARQPGPGGAAAPPGAAHRPALEAHAPGPVRQRTAACGSCSSGTAGPSCTATSPLSGPAAGTRKWWDARHDHPHPRGQAVRPDPHRPGGRELPDRSGRVHLPHRAQRRRQVHPAQAAVPGAGAHHRGDPDGRPPAGRPCRSRRSPSSGARWASCSRTSS